MDPRDEPRDVASKVKEFVEKARKDPAVMGRLYEAYQELREYGMRSA